MTGRLAPIAKHALFPWLAGVLAFGATLSMTIPTVPLLCALVSLDRTRWRAIAFWAVVGSALGGALFVHLLGHFGVPYLAAKLPELVATSHWRHLVEASSHHGWWVLIAVAASPIGQTPVLFLSAILGMPTLTVFASLFAGKAMKYGLMAGLTSMAVNEISTHQPVGRRRIDEAQILAGPFR